jgi:hypothetical protein
VTHGHGRTVTLTRDAGGESLATLSDVRVTVTGLGPARLTAAAAAGRPASDTGTAGSLGPRAGSDPGRAIGSTAPGRARRHRPARPGQSESRVTSHGPGTLPPRPAAALAAVAAAARPGSEHAQY